MMCMLVFYILYYGFFVIVRYRSGIVVTRPPVKVREAAILS